MPLSRQPCRCTCMTQHCNQHWICAPRLGVALHTRRTSSLLQKASRALGAYSAVRFLPIACQFLSNVVLCSFFIEKCCRDFGIFTKETQNKFQHSKLPLSRKLCAALQSSQKLELPRSTATCAENTSIFSRLLGSENY